MSRQISDIDPNRRVVWRHTDGRTLIVYNDRKLRRGFPDPDQWPTLSRPQAMSDTEWFAPPNEEWIQD